MNLWKRVKQLEEDVGRLRCDHDFLPDFGYAKEGKFWKSLDGLVDDIGGRIDCYIVNCSSCGKRLFTSESKIEFLREKLKYLGSEKRRKDTGIDDQIATTKAAIKKEEL